MHFWKLGKKIGSCKVSHPGIGVERCPTSMFKVTLVSHTVAKSKFLSKNSISMDSAPILNLNFCAQKMIFFKRWFLNKKLYFATVCISRLDRRDMASCAAVGSICNLAHAFLSLTQSQNFTKTRKLRPYPKVWKSAFLLLYSLRYLFNFINCNCLSFIQFQFF